MDIIQSVIANMTIILAIIGTLAFVVSVVTQVIKGVGVFSKVPTDILVFVLSIGITVAAFVAYMQYIQTSILWYWQLLLQDLLLRLSRCMAGKSFLNCGRGSARM